MTTPRRLLAASAALALSALALVACATPAGSSGGPTSAATTPPPASAGGDLAAAWLDDGRMIAVVTWGSSTCVPIAGEVVVDGQSLSVELLDPAADSGSEKACTADYAPRGTAVGVPAGVDPAQDVSITVTYDGTSLTTELDGDEDLAGAGGEGTDYLPSAGWFAEDGFAILTWGSSSCAPVVEAVEAEGPDAVTVTFVEPPADQVCTMDMAPRLNLVNVTTEGDEDDVALTLVGDSLDVTIPIRGDR